MKKIITFIITILISMITVQNVEALNMGRVTNGAGLNVRKGPSTSYNIATSLKYNDVVVINSFIAENKTSNCPSGWYNVTFNDISGYVCASYISTSQYTVRVNSTSTLNVRNGAGSNYAIYKKLNNNAFLTLTSTEKTKNSSCPDGWYLLNYDTVRTKAVCSTYTDNYNDNSNVTVTTQNGVILKISSFKDTSIKINYGNTLTLYDKTLHKGSNCSGGYYKVYYKNTAYYICSNDVLNTHINGSINTYSGANVRTSPSSESTRIKTLPYATSVSLENTKTYDGEGCPNGWYKIKLNGSYGYICSSIITTTSKTAKITSSLKTNIRTAPSAKGTVVTSIPTNTTLLLESTTKYGTEDCPAGWYKIFFNQKENYVCGSNTSLYKETSSSSNKKTVTKESSSSGNYYLINKWTYRINEDYAIIRSSASTSSSSKDTLYLGTEVEVLGESPAGNGCSSGWYKISYYNNKTGYTCKHLVDKYEDITKNDSSYCNKLKSAGFPESYCPYLSYLHSKHPNWQFKAENTGISFLTAVDGEEGKNYTQITKTPYLKSTAIAEAGGWRVASNAYITFMLDPRNYLNEKNIFVFEQLSYDKTNHTTSAVRAIVDGTYLDTDTYAGYFVTYGKQYNVSPIHLAARAKQEGAANESYDAVSGKVTSRWKNTEGYVCGNYITFPTNDFYKIVDTSVVNIRKEPNSSSTILMKETKGTKVMILDDTAHKTDDCNKNKGFIKVQINDTVGYICSIYLEKDDSKNTIGYVNSSSSLNVRSGPSTNYDTKTTVKKYAMFNKVDNKITETSNCSKGWYHVKFVGYSLAGIYNFYNIGSYGDNPVLRGLTAAAGYVDDLDGTPWNSRAKAIKYGAAFIANGYISKGQDTMYYQKFNTGPNAQYSKYTHQYMTNILAPASESLSTYNSYTDLNLINKALVFKIPVYSNMPTSSTTHPPVTN